MEKKEGKSFKETQKLNNVNTVRWEELTSAEFPVAARKSRGVCVLPMGVIEKHGEHLPLGTDYLQAHYIACLAAEKEFAVVFPPFYFGQIYPARCFPGTITIKPTLLIELIQAVFDEIGRNGFKKIIIYNRHGDNTPNLLFFLSQYTLWEEKPYYVYVPRSCFPLTPEREKEWKSICETARHGHACECETSITLAIYPNLVKMNKIPKTPAMPLERLKHLPPVFTSVSWYSNYPEWYAGDARPATTEKGHKLIQLLVDSFAEYIAAVKSDKVAPTLTKEFYQRVKNLGKKVKSSQ